MALDYEFVVGLLITTLVGFGAIAIWAFITLVLEDTSYED